MMYDELIKRLRECTAEQNGEKTLWHQAADAIEDLDNRLNLHRQGKIGHWIPVTERLPDVWRDVLCFCRANICLVLSRDGNHWQEGADRYYMSGFVTHWMQLPEPPESEEA